MATFEFPIHFEPRPYQVPFLSAMRDGCKRAVLVWHRRSGKDKTALNLMAACAAGHARVGVYYYFFPTYAQAKKVIWDGIDKDGMKYMAHFPEKLIDDRNETDMKLRMKSGSIFQLVGTDNLDSIRGTNPIGCVFSEYSFQNPRAWDIVRPILRENGGWAAFLFTPNGKNHGLRLYESAQREVTAKNPEWFVELRTVRDTVKPEKFGSLPVISEADVEDERRTGMDEDLIQQEYYCSFTGGIHGSYYSSPLDALDKAQRIGSVPYNPAYPVYTAWDIGVGDSTAIWFWQEIGTEYLFIDYLEGSGEGLPYYKRLLDERKYIYGPYHDAPHDIEAREFGSGVSRIETANRLGLRFRIVPRLSPEEGIEAVRRILPLCRFDRERCSRGLDALYSYRKIWDDTKKCFLAKPYHDWASDGADAFRYFAVGRRRSTEILIRNRYSETEFDPLNYEQDRRWERGRNLMSETEFNV